MRANKTIVISCLTVSLLAGSTVAVARQDSEEPGSRDGTLVTGFIEGWSSTEEPPDIADDGVVEVREWTFEAEVTDASDARLVGTLTDVRSFDDLPSAPMVVVSHWRISNQGGSWVGHATEMPGWGGTALLKGTDDYEGLSAFLVISPRELPERFDGVIFDGELPPFPEPPSDD